MRQKTDEKRQQILSVASGLFLKYGLDGVSMSQIAAKVGGSKSTIYGYYENKEELFLEVVLTGIEQMVKSASASLDPSLPLFEKLHVLGVKYLTFVLSEDIIALRRIVLTTTHKSEEGRIAYHQVVKTSWEHVVSLITEAIKEGLLKECDPWQAANQLRCLFEYDLVDRRLLNIADSIGNDEIEKTVAAGLEVFRCYYEKKKENV